jgi:phage terminase small subunit
MAYRQENNLRSRRNGRTTNKRLTDKQVAFAIHYAATLNGAESVREAGYKCAPGNEIRMSAELRNHPVIAEFIEEEMDKRRKKADVSAQYVLEKLVKIVEATEENNPQSALRGLELIGKHLGMYRDRQEISGPDGGAIEMKQKVTQDIAEFESAIDRLAKRSGETEVLVFPKSGSNS